MMECSRPLKVSAVFYQHSLRQEAQDKHWGWKGYSLALIALYQRRVQLQGVESFMGMEETISSSGNRIGYLCL